MLRRFAGINLAFVALIALSIGLGAALTAQERGLREGSARAAAPFDVIVAAPGSEITMLLAAVYLQPSDVPLLTGAQYAEVSAAPGVSLAAPPAFGTVTKARRSSGRQRMFATVDEAVAGAFAAVEVGASFTPVHGHGPGAEEHEGSEYLVTGRMRPSGSPWDRAILVPFEGVWQVHGLPDGHADSAGEGHAGDHDDHDHAHADHDHGHDHDTAAVRPVAPPFDPAMFPGTPAVLLRADSIAAA